MKLPPFLMLAATLFWGWQTDFLVEGVIMGVLLESARYVTFRWDLDDADFNRIWSFCVLLNVALTAYVFTNNDGGGLGKMLHGNATLNLVNASALSGTRFLRWLPMTTFAFIAAQQFNERPSVPLTAISLVLRWRRRQGDRGLAGHYYDITHPYFMMCLFSASIHANDNSRTYFFGLGALTVWALWGMRPQRYRFFTWVAALAAVAMLGLVGLVGITRAQIAIQAFNAQMLAKLFSGRTDPLQTMTSMGRIGQMKLSAKILVRLEPDVLGNVPNYLREASYRNYSPQNMMWHIGGGRHTDYELIAPETNNTSWILVPGKTNTASVNVACYLEGRNDDGDHEGVLPLPSGCSRLENLPAVTSVISLQKTKTGAVLAAGAGLLIFDAHFGPGATLDAPPDLTSTNRYDLTVPAVEIPALKEVISEMSLTATNDFERRRAIEKFFLDKFTYSMWQGKEKRGDSNGTPLTKFLRTSRSGHCEYFASATVLLLRELGIPARYAVGYYVHEAHGSGYVVRARDGHAWCLAWDSATKTWVDFDTTPPSWVSIEDQRAGFGEWLTDMTSWIGYQVAKFRWRQANLQQYILWSLIPVMLVLLYHIIFRRRGRGRANKNRAGKMAAANWPGLDSEFYQLEKMLAARGLPRQGGEPLTGWLERSLREPAINGLRAPLDGLLRLHYRHRFDPDGLSTVEREALRREAQAVREELLRVKR